MRVKKLLIVLGISVMAVGCCGCGKKKAADSTTTTTESGNVSLSTPEDATEELQESDDTGSVSVGKYEGDITYKIDSFDVKIELPDGWMFANSEEIAGSTGKSVEEIEKLWNEEQSVYDSEITYLCIAYDNNGSNVIMNYCSPAVYGDSELTAAEYIESAAENYPDSKVETKTLAGKKYECLKLTGDNGYSQEMYCTQKDGIILMITFTTNEGNEEECYSLIK